MCIHPYTRMILVKRGHAPGSFGVKNFEKIAVLSLSGYLLLEFMSDVLQTWYVYSPIHKDDPREKGSRSGVI